MKYCIVCREEYQADSVESDEEGMCPACRKEQLSCGFSQYEMTTCQNKETDICISDCENCENFEN